ncbi:hypothetical protein HJB56_04955 [Rhizobium lentis]|uniref:hypothetical protein n=1 Tax=Rhizobium lentis TaxID=1138194 RepID=UPI001C840312|nr:hypothetical protein [Rhizobium lentis]MBX5082135.1 hypothetical protein [Rhizobium lentis]MBX5094845.1 hypothetical protein [Rhizobium lentis]MBX5119570.1 hypothetical protein [Rhizobium lentis]
MAEIVHFPRPLARPRLVDVSQMSAHDHASFQAAVQHLVEASQKIVAFALATPSEREAAVAASADAAEAALFHLLTMKGAFNADLPLRRLLVERGIERSKS